MLEMINKEEVSIHTRHKGYEYLLEKHIPELNKLIDENNGQIFVRLDVVIDQLLDNDYKNKTFVAIKSGLTRCLKPVNIGVSEGTLKDGTMALIFYRRRHKVGKNHET